MVQLKGCELQPPIRFLDATPTARPCEQTQMLSMLESEQETEVV
jgi:hypothetical protein